MSSSDPRTDKAFGSATSPATDGLSTQLILGQIGQYDLLLKLGEGGMGQVFKARHRLMDQVVALKVIHQRALDRPDAVERFHREIRALAKLTHPNIVRAQYADHVEGTNFLVMEYVAGPNLADVVSEQGPLPVPAACAFIQQAACGLQHAYELGMVHRDIKPSNLLVAPDGQVKILDLGLALIRETAPDTKELTATGQVFGTYDYMAPEQWDDSHGVDIRADLYSLGCTLYFLLTGKPPFGSPTYSTATQKMKAHTLAPVPRLSGSQAGVPSELDGILGRLMAKDPKERFATPQELIEALAPFAGANKPLSGMRMSVASIQAPTIPLGSASASTLHPTVPGRDRRAWSSPRSWSRSSVLVPLLLLVIGGAGVGGYFVWDAGRGKPVDTGSAAVEPPPLKILKFELLHTRIKDNEPMPPRKIDALGRNESPVHLGDKMKVEVRLSEPAYSYLLILKPDGKRQIAFPLPITAVPTRQEEYLFPPAPKVTYLLESGTGLETCLFMASRKPLPSFEDWHKEHGSLPWRKGLVDSFAWYGDNAGLASIDDHRAEKKPASEDASALVKLREHLMGLSDIEVFAFITFPVERRPVKN